MNSVSDVYIHFNLGIDKGEITYMIYLEELIYIFLFIYLFRERRSHPHVSTMAPAVEPKTRSSIHPSSKQEEKMIA